MRGNKMANEREIQPALCCSAKNSVNNSPFLPVSSLLDSKLGLMHTFAHSNIDAVLDTIIHSQHENKSTLLLRSAGSGRVVCTATNRYVFPAEGRSIHAGNVQQ